MVKYDELVMNTDSELKKISTYLKKPITLFTDKVKQKSALNSRKASILNRKNKLIDIKEDASELCIDQLDEWIHSYNQIIF